MFETDVGYAKYQVLLFDSFAAFIVEAMEYT